MPRKITKSEKSAAMVKGWDVQESIYKFQIMKDGYPIGEEGEHYNTEAAAWRAIVEALEAGKEPKAKL